MADLEYFGEAAGHYPRRTILRRAAALVGENIDSPTLKEMRMKRKSRRRDTIC